MRAEAMKRMLQRLRELGVPEAQLFAVVETVTAAVVMDVEMMRLEKREEKEAN